MGVHAGVGRATIPSEGRGNADLEETLSLEGEHCADCEDDGLVVVYIGLLTRKETRKQAFRISESQNIKSRLIFTSFLCVFGMVYDASFLEVDDLVSATHCAADSKFCSVWKVAALQWAQLLPWALFSNALPGR